MTDNQIVLYICISCNRARRGIKNENFVCDVCKSANYTIWEGFQSDEDDSTAGLEGNSSQD